MKKILFGSAAAICAVVGFSSFKTASTTTFYFFSLEDSYFPGTPPVPSAGTIGFKNVGALTDLNYIAKTTSPGVDPVIGCPDGPHWCSVAFTDSQVQQIGTSGIYQLKQTVMGNTITEINVEFGSKA